jgi:hypothetical protein
MPLREPPAAPRGPEASGPSGGRTTTPSLQLSLGSQIYARGVKDARMAVMEPLATNVRGGVQRRPAAGPASLQTLPASGQALIMGLARSTLNTSVLPQTRVQREDDPQNQPQNQLVPVTPPTGTLPLAPPGSAPVNGNPSPPTPTSTALVPSQSSQNLPLAPIVSRDAGNTERQMVTLGQNDDDEDTKGIDLDDLAEQLLPYIKRLMGVERQRDEPI